MNNIVMRKIVVTGTYAALSNKPREVVSVEISTPPGNTGTVYFQGDDGSDVPWLQGEWHTLISVNLAEIKIKGTPGDVVTVVGGTW